MQLRTLFCTNLLSYSYVLADLRIGCNEKMYDIWICRVCNSKPAWAAILTLSTTAIRVLAVWDLDLKVPTYRPPILMYY